MPHQCIGCGETFPEGSTELLQGCPECEGTRFFFTETALGPKERAELKKETKENMREAIRKALEKPDYTDQVWSWEERERWLRLEPDDVREVLQEVVEDTDADGVPDLPTDPDGPSAEALAKAKALMEGKEPTFGDGPGQEDPAGAGDPAPTPDGANATGEEDASAPETPPNAEPLAPTTQDLPTGPKTSDEGDDAAKPTSTVRIHEPGRYDIDVESLLDANPVIVEKDGTYMVHLPSVFTSVEKERSRRGRRRNRS